VQQSATTETNALAAAEKFTSYLILELPVSPVATVSIILE
jgi:hypothetical protein